MSLLSPQLEAFIAISESGTVRGAAGGLGITQTGVTQRLRALEQSLSSTLFLRSRKGMILTPEGQALLRYCRAARDLEGQTLAEVSGKAVARPVRVSITGPTSILRSRIVPACTAILPKFKTLSLSFVIDDLESRAEKLRTGECQFAILNPGSVSREMESRLLKPEKYLLVGPADWKGRRLAEVARSERIIDFDPTDPMSFAYLARFKIGVDDLPERHFVNSTESVAQMIAQGAGYGVLTAEFAEPWLRSGKLTLLNSGRALESRLALAWYHRPHPPSYFSAILSACR